MTLKTIAQRMLVRARRRVALHRALTNVPGGSVMVAIGDSFVSGEPFLRAQDTFAPIVADGLGLRLAFSDGQGGTGYARDAHGRADAFPRRISDLAGFRPEVLLISGGYNDTWDIAKFGTQREVYAAVRETLAAARTIASQVIVVGPIWPRDGIVPEVAEALSDHVEACCSELGLHFVESLRVFESVDRGAMIDRDGTHPTLAGQKLLAQHVLLATSRSPRFPTS